MSEGCLCQMSVYVSEEVCVKGMGMYQRGGYVSEG